MVDRQAAGCGWFIDPTPWEDSEYVLGQPLAGVDLLTVVMHEMGHALGYQDLDNRQFPQALMALQLMPEQARRVPTGPFVTGTNPLEPNDVNGDGNITSSDALSLINRINVRGAALTPVESGTSPMYYDVTADSVLSASDVVPVINWLNTPQRARVKIPVFEVSSNTSALVAASELITPPLPPGSRTIAAGTVVPATYGVASPNMGPTTRVPVASVADNEDSLANEPAAQPDKLAADVFFYELGS